MERPIEIEEPFPGLSKKRLVLVELSLGKTRPMKSDSDTIRHPSVSRLVPNQKYMAKVMNYGKIYFQSEESHPEKHRKSSQTALK